MVAEIIRPPQFSVDPLEVGPVQRMRLGSAGAANAFNAVENGLAEVDQESHEEERRAADLMALSETLSLQMHRLVQETDRFVRVLRAD